MPQFSLPLLIGLACSTLAGGLHARQPAEMAAGWQAPGCARIQFRQFIRGQDDGQMRFGSLPVSANGWDGTPACEPWKQLDQGDSSGLFATSGRVLHATRREPGSQVVRTLEERGIAVTGTKFRPTVTAVRLMDRQSSRYAPQRV